MQFLTPLFGLATALLAVPILLHLVHREKTRRTPFASLMFLRRIPIKELQRRRLTHLFLLFLRCLGVFLLVLAFTRPVVTGIWFAQVNPLASRSVVILLDHSLSMSPQSIWERAMEAAEERIQDLGDSDEALVMAFGETAKVLSLWETSQEKLRAVLHNRAAPSFESTSYVEGLRVATEQFGSNQKGRREIYLITDLQQAGLTGTAGWRIPEPILVEVKDVGEGVPNLFVEEVRLERNVFADQYPHPILVRVGASHPQDVSGEAQLFIQGEMVDRKAFQIGSEGATNVTFKPFQLNEGISRGRILIQPSDGIPADNVYHFVVERQEPRQVLVLGTRKESALYLEKALSSGNNLPFTVKFSTPPGPAQIEPEQVPVVVMNDLEQLPDPARFQTYLAKGGGLIVVLGNHVRSLSYNRDWQALLPAELTDRFFVRKKNKPFTSITEANWEHPIFSIFQDVHKAGIVSTQFYGYWQLSPKSGSLVLARFSEGAPVMVERSAGKGRVMLFASSLDAIWTDFPLRSAYVPFWYRSVQYAARWQSAPAALRINQVVPVEETAEESTVASSGTWNLIDPRGRRVISLEQEPPGFVPLEQPGHYEIRSQKRSDWVAVNCPVEESRLERVSLEEFQAAFVPLESRLQEASLEGSIKDQDQQQSLWWLLLLLALAVFMVESAVANRARITQGSRHEATRTRNRR